ncbi:MAG: patatin-like phospholipase family protein [Spirochaetaceae bacterium]|nr:patatin-like phospholipase family protein [Spirochaetaceae bacterium]MCF7948421.1 patatin-like phospholipase family protein [Spirochaetia bacterium]MCF7950717.1 patatin-like phospholipase family protein [Spirochaetaceae bacterium]
MPLCRANPKRFFYTWFIILFLIALPRLFAAPSVAAETSLPEAPVDQLVQMDQTVFLGEDQFKERITRPVSGRESPLGLLLSGGSARALAHIGVLKRLEESGYAPDFIVTNSMGSIVGLLYGAGLSPDTIQSLLLQLDLASLFQPEIPLHGGLLNPTEFIELIEEYVPYDNIEDFPIPVMVVCEDLRTKQKVVLAEGDFSTVLAASFALPFYFPPQNLGPYRLIDGGVANLAPLSIPYRYSDSVLLSSTFYQKELNLSNPITNLNVAMDIGKSRSAIEDIKQYNPVWIRCAVEEFSFMEWYSIKEIVARGYESAEDTLTSERFSSLSDTIQAVPGEYLGQAREKSQIALSRGLKEYQRTGLVHVELVRIGARVGIQLSESPYERPLFGDRNRFTLGAYAKSGYSETRIKLFYQPEYLNQYQLTDKTYTGAGFEFTWMPGRLLLLSGFSDLIFTDDYRVDSTFVFHSTHSSGELFLPFRIASGTVLGPIAGVELTTDETFHTDSYVLHGGIKGDTGPSQKLLESFTTKVSYTQAGDTAFEADVKLEQQFVGPLHLQQRLFTRLPLAQSGTVPYYPSDYYKPRVSPEQVNRLLIVSTNAVLAFPGFQPTFGETLIMEQLSFGPFFDLRETGSTELNYALGGEVSTALSLLGLKPIMLQMNGGWSYDTQEWFFSLTLWS